jgi:hypothetical protein
MSAWAGGWVDGCVCVVSDSDESLYVCVFSTCCVFVFDSSQVAEVRMKELKLLARGCRTNTDRAVIGYEPRLRSCLNPCQTCVWVLVWVS